MADAKAMIAGIGPTAALALLALRIPCTGCPARPEAAKVETAAEAAKRGNHALP